MDYETITKEVELIMSLNNILTDLETDLYTFCSINGLMNGEKPCIKFIIKNKKIALKATVNDKKASSFLKQFSSFYEMINGTLFQTSSEGIDRFIEVHKQFLESLAEYSSFDYTDLYLLIRKEN